MNSAHENVRMAELIEHVGCDFYRYNEKLAVLSMYQLCSGGEYTRTEIQL